MELHCVVSFGDCCLGAVNTSVLAVLLLIFILGFFSRISKRENYMVDSRECRPIYYRTLVRPFLFSVRLNKNQVEENYLFYFSNCASQTSRVYIKCISNLIFLFSPKEDSDWITTFRYIPFLYFILGCTFYQSPYMVSLFFFLFSGTFPKSFQDNTLLSQINKIKNDFGKCLQVNVIGRQNLDLSHVVVSLKPWKQDRCLELSGPAQISVNICYVALEHLDIKGLMVKFFSYVITLKVRSDDVHNMLKVLSLQNFVVLKKQVKQLWYKRTAELTIIIFNEHLVS